MINSSQLRNLISITVSFVEHCPEVEYEETVILDGTNIRNESGADYLIESFSSFLLNSFEKVSPAFQQSINQDDVISWVRIFTEFVEGNSSVFVNRRSPLSLNCDHMDDTEYLKMIISEFGKQVLSFVNDKVDAISCAANDEPEKRSSYNDFEKPAGEFNFTTFVNSTGSSKKSSPYSDISDRDIANLAFNSSREDRQPYIVELYMRGLTRPGVSKEDTFDLITCAESFIDGFDAVMPLHDGHAQETFSVFSDGDDLLLEFTVSTQPATAKASHEAEIVFSAGTLIDGTEPRFSRIEFSSDKDHYVSRLRHVHTIGKFLHDGLDKYEINDRQSAIAIGTVSVTVLIDPDKLRLTVMNDGECVADYEFRNAPTSRFDSDDAYDNVIYLK